LNVKTRAVFEAEADGLLALSVETISSYEHMSLEYLDRFN
jgi:hypothetical protein